MLVEVGLCPDYRSFVDNFVINFIELRYLHSQCHATYRSSRGFLIILHGCFQVRSLNVQEDLIYCCVKFHIMELITETDVQIKIYVLVFDLLG